ncbi:unnamed protein product [Diatraea saccharalis]|uniref:Uncharacterized protein n=1 Tax=Diatraea saccharalis TaxID=40085 RepID=A0A9N9R532_9NEOP|nr:unnamed protein product [Diatraea saccharalis]
MLALLRHFSHLTSRLDQIKLKISRSTAESEPRRPPRPETGDLGGVNAPLSLTQAPTLLRRRSAGAWHHKSVGHPLLADLLRTPGAGSPGRPLFRRPPALRWKWPWSGETGPRTQAHDPSAGLTLECWDRPDAPRSRSTSSSWARSRSGGAAPIPSARTQSLTHTHAHSTSTYTHTHSHPRHHPSLPLRKRGFYPHHTLALFLHHSSILVSSFFTNYPLTLSTTVGGGPPRIQRDASRPHPPPLINLVSFTIIHATLHTYTPTSDHSSAPFRDHPSSCPPPGISMIPPSQGDLKLLLTVFESACSISLNNANDLTDLNNSADFNNANNFDTYEES